MRVKISSACFGTMVMALAGLMGSGNTAFAAVTQADVNTAINDGVAYLLTQQDGAGCWTSQGITTGITALAHLAIINSPANGGGYGALGAAEKAAVDAGTACLLTKVQGDGSIVDFPGSLTTYNTSIAIWALSEVPGSVPINSAIAGGRAWLLGNQYDAGTVGVWDANCVDGGWYYEGGSTSNFVEHSNSSFALQGLAATGGVPGAGVVPIPGSVADLAQRYFKCLQRGGPGAAGCGACNGVTGLDRGFTYYQGGGFSTTNNSGSSVFALRLTGLPAAALELVDGRKFLDEALSQGGAGSMSHNDDFGLDNLHWAVGGDPGHYAPWAAEKAYTLSGIPSSLTDATNWYYKLANALVAEQNANGSWPTYGREDEILSTSFSLLALLQVATETDIPTLSEWGLVVLTLLLLAGAKLYFRHRAVSAIA